MTVPATVEALVRAGYDVIRLKAPCDPSVGWSGPVEPRRVYATLARPSSTKWRFWSACARRARLPEPTLGDIDAAIMVCVKRANEAA